MIEQERCNFCGSTDYEERRIDYLYSHKGNYLIAQDTPVEICSDCGMVYYDAAVLKEIEEHFFAIQQRREEAENYMKLPTLHYAG
jgi:YgiT-type zinc finger domain-containing protein